MNQVPRWTAFTLAIALVGCAAQAPAVWADAKTAEATQGGENKLDPDLQIVLAGMRMVEEGHPLEAIEGPFGDVIKRYEAKYAASDKKIYSADGAREVLVYMMMAASAKPPVSAVALGPAWAAAYWGRGYAFNELGRHDDAIVELNKALELAPMDSQYNIELAFAYQQKHEWERSLGLYRSAYAYAELSADDVPEMQCKALRGEGFNLVELGRFDEARKAYRECLKLKPGEPKSVGELQYIDQQEHNGK